MECPQDPPQSLSPPAVAGRFTWHGLLLAMLVAPLFGLIWAWTADVAQFYFAPIILFPLLLGVFAGLSIVGLVRFAQIGYQPTIFLAAVLTAIVAAAGQHYCGYLATYYGMHPSAGASTATGQDVSALMREMTPSFGAYMQAQARRGRPLVQGYVAHGWIAWLSWAIDALLVVAAAVVVVIPAVRVPYCNRCRSWYRTIRSGKIDVPTALRLAELVGVEEINRPRSPRYRLSACQGGCGPTRCELSWEDAGGAVVLASVWLDPAGRNRVAAILDGVESGQDKTQTLPDP